MKNKIFISYLLLVATSIKAETMQDQATAHEDDPAYTLKTERYSSTQTSQEIIDFQASIAALQQTSGNGSLGTITGNSGGALSGTNVTLSGGTTGLSFIGSGSPLASTATLSFTGITANGGNANIATDTTTNTVNIGTGSGTTTVALGTGSNVSSVNIGSTNGASTTTIQSGGTSGNVININSAGLAGQIGIQTNDGQIAINSGAGLLSLSGDDADTTINIGTGTANATKTVMVGSTNGASTTTIQSGGTSGNVIYINSAGLAGQIGIQTNDGQIAINSGAGLLSLSGDDANTTVNIGTGTTNATKTVTVGSTNGASTTTIQSGTGALNITAIDGPLSIDSGTGNLNISTDAANTAVNIGTGATNIKTVNIGSTGSTSTTTLNSGTGGVQITSFLNVPATSSATVGTYNINNSPVLHSKGGISNIFVGINAGNLIGTIGNNNTGVGNNALHNLTTTGSNNTAIGQNAGSNYTGSDSSNICINNTGTASESHTLRIGAGTGSTNAGELNRAFIAGIRTANVTGSVVFVDPSDQLGIGTVPVASGGTGATTLTSHGVLLGNGTSAVTATVAGATSTVLLGNTGASPSFGVVPNAALANSSVTLSNGNNITVTGGSSLSLGGTASFNLTGTTNNALQVGNATGSLSSLGFGTSGQALVSVGAGAQPAFGTLPVVGGGTGATTLTSHGVLLGQGTSNVTATGVGTVGQVLLGAGAADPTFVTPTAGAGLTLTANASTLSYGLTVPVTVPLGGTGATNFVAYAPLVGGTTSTGALQSIVSAGTSGQVLTSNGPTTLPTFQTPSSGTTITGNSGGTLTGSGFTFTGGVTGLSFGGSGTTETLGGTLVVGSGGTGATTLTAHGVLLGNGTGTIASASPSATTGYPLISNGATVDPSFGSYVNVPSTTSATVGTYNINGSPVLHSKGSNTNIFVGDAAGNFSLTGNNNTGVGYQALQLMTSTTGSTAIGYRTLANLSAGNANTALGEFALEACTTGTANTAIGNTSCPRLLTGVQNIAIGQSAGFSYAGSESSNICINNAGTASESNTLRIGAGTGTTTRQLNKAFIAGIRGITTTTADAISVLIDSNGQLGTVSSSIRFKDNIKDMDEASSGILNLRPVTFTYKNQAGERINPGLIAEEVESVMPSLVVYNKNGEIETVRYHELPALLLNELQKSVRKVTALENNTGSSALVATVAAHLLLSKHTLLTGTIEAIFAMQDTINSFADSALSNSLTSGTVIASPTIAFEEAMLDIMELQNSISSIFNGSNKTGSALADKIAIYHSMVTNIANYAAAQITLNAEIALATDSEQKGKMIRLAAACNYLSAVSSNQAAILASQIALQSQLTSDAATAAEFIANATTHLTEANSTCAIAKAFLADAVLLAPHRYLDRNGMSVDNKSNALSNQIGFMISEILI